MFESAHTTSLATRLRDLCLWPYLAFVSAHAYFDALSFFPSLPDWLYPLIALFLLSTVVAGLAGGARLMIRNRSELDVRSILWAAALASGIALSAMTFVRLISPFLP